MIFHMNNFVVVFRLYNESPVRKTIVTNDRWGSDAVCKHGGFLNCDDRFNPGNVFLSFLLKFTSYDCVKVFK